MRDEDLLAGALQGQAQTARLFQNTGPDRRASRERGHIVWSASLALLLYTSQRCDGIWWMFLGLLCFRTRGASSGDSCTSAAEN